MKVSSGQLKNRPIYVYKNSSLRPTEAIVKRSLITTIKPKLLGSFFLDLFAGTGAVGLEAYSNGASYVGFIERDKKLFFSLLENIHKYIIPGVALRGSYHERIRFFLKKNIRFDFIFIDPPYNFKESYPAIIKNLLQYQLLKKTGMVIIERNKNRIIENKEGDFLANNFTHWKTRKFGSTLLDYYRYYSQAKLREENC